MNFWGKVPYNYMIQRLIVIQVQKYKYVVRFSLSLRRSFLLQIQYVSSDNELFDANNISYIFAEYSFSRKNILFEAKRRWVSEW